MLLKIIVVGALLIGLMAAIRDGRLLKDAGLLSTCNAAPASGKADPTLLACTSGRLDGFPDLTNKSCALVSARPNRQFWRCEAPLVSSQRPTG